jgi:hypothetical protein
MKLAINVETDAVQSAGALQSVKGGSTLAIHARFVRGAAAEPVGEETIEAALKRAPGGDMTLLASVAPGGFSEAGAPFTYVAEMDLDTAAIRAALGYGTGDSADDAGPLDCVLEIAWGEAPKRRSASVAVQLVQPVGYDEGEPVDPEAPSGHTHEIADVQGLEAELDAKADLVDGKVPAEQLPSSAVAARVTVANEAARAALTLADVQNGDYVYQSDNSTLYQVTDAQWLGQENSLDAFTAMATVAWESVTNKPTEFPPEAHTHSISDLTDLPAIGGGDMGDIATLGQLNSVQSDAANAQSAADNAQSAIDTHTGNEQAGTHIAAATDTARGTIEIATAAEAKALSSATLALTPSTLKDVIGDNPLNGKWVWENGFGIAYDPTTKLVEIQGMRYLANGTVEKLPAPQTSWGASIEMLGLLTLACKWGQSPVYGPGGMWLARANQGTSLIYGSHTTAQVGVYLGTPWLYMASAISLANGDTITGNVTGATAKVYQATGLPGSVQDFSIYDITGLFTTADTNLSVNGTPTGVGISNTVWGTSPDHKLLVYLNYTAATGCSVFAVQNRTGGNMYFSLNFEGSL